jgi:formylglycine-generating enzyme required for sulfatase activity
MKPDVGTRTRSMIEIGAGCFQMGSDDHYPEEAPARFVEVAGFRIDATAVTNDDFAAFVRETGYVTTCERPIDRDTNPGMPDDFYKPGSLVFQMTAGPVRLDDPRQWWKLVYGACWKHPEGPQSNLDGRGDHPVGHVSYLDALAYAHWAGKKLPTETQWEYAVKSIPHSPAPPNIWRGAFPHHNIRTDGPPFTVAAHDAMAQTGCLHNMLGNVWEWTQDKFMVQTSGNSACCTAATNAPTSVERVLKGGSHLCADSYCRRYRPAARIGAAEESSTSHTGFRWVTG